MTIDQWVHEKEQLTTLANNTLLKLLDGFLGPRSYSRLGNFSTRSFTDPSGFESCKYENDQKLVTLLFSQSLVPRPFLPWQIRGQGVSQDQGGLRWDRGPESHKRKEETLPNRVKFSRLKHLLILYSR